MKRSTVSSTHCCIQRSAHTVPTVWVIACPKKPHASSTGHNPSITKLQMTFTAESHNSLVHHLVIKKKYTQFPLCYRVRSSASVRMPTVSLRVATLKNTSKSAVFWDMTPFYCVKCVRTPERIPQRRNTQQKLTWKYLQTVAHFLFLGTPFAEDTAVIGVKLVYRIQPLHHPRTNAQQVAQVTLQQMTVTASYLEQPCDSNKHLHTQHWHTYWIQNHLEMFTVIWSRNSHILQNPMAQGHVH